MSRNEISDTILSRGSGSLRSSEVKSMDCYYYSMIYSFYCSIIAIDIKTNIIIHIVWAS